MHDRLHVLHITPTVQAVFPLPIMLDMPWTICIGCTQPNHRPGREETKARLHLSGAQLYFLEERHRQEL